MLLRISIYLASFAYGVCVTGFGFISLEAGASGSIFGILGILYVRKVYRSRMPFAHQHVNAVEAQSKPSLQPQFSERALKEINKIRESESARNSEINA